MNAKQILEQIQKLQEGLDQVADALSLLMGEEGKGGAGSGGARSGAGRPRGSGGGESGEKPIPSDREVRRNDKIGKEVDKVITDEVDSTLQSIVDSVSEATTMKEIDEAAKEIESSLGEVDLGSAINASDVASHYLFEAAANVARKVQAQAIAGLKERFGSSPKELRDDLAHAEQVAEELENDGDNSAAESLYQSVTEATRSLNLYMKDPTEEGLDELDDALTTVIQESKRD
jgi:hypothetical protein